MEVFKKSFLALFLVLLVVFASSCNVITAKEQKEKVSSIVSEGSNLKLEELAINAIQELKQSKKKTKFVGIGESKFAADSFKPFLSYLKTIDSAFETKSGFEWDNEVLGNEEIFGKVEEYSEKGLNKYSVILIDSKSKDFEWDKFVEDGIVYTFLPIDWLRGSELKKEDLGEEPLKLHSVSSGSSGDDEYSEYFMIPSNAALPWTALAYMTFTSCTLSGYEPWAKETGYYPVNKDVLEEIEIIYEKRIKRVNK